MYIFMLPVIDNGMGGGNTETGKGHGHLYNVHICMWLPIPKKGFYSWSHWSYQINIRGSYEWPGQTLIKGTRSSEVRTTEHNAKRPNANVEWEIHIYFGYTMPWSKVMNIMEKSKSSKTLQKSFLGSFGTTTRCF